jgi:hypothetical protein
MLRFAQFLIHGEHTAGHYYGNERDDRSISDRRRTSPTEVNAGFDAAIFAVRNR